MESIEFDINEARTLLADSEKFNYNKPELIVEGFELLIVIANKANNPDNKVALNLLNTYSNKILEDSKNAFRTKSYLQCSNIARTLTILKSLSGLESIRKDEFECLHLQMLDVILVCDCSPELAERISKSLREDKNKKQA